MGLSSQQLVSLALASKKASTLAWAPRSKIPVQPPVQVALQLHRQPLTSRQPTWISEGNHESTMESYRERQWKDHLLFYHILSSSFSPFNRSVHQLDIQLADFENMCLIVLDRHLQLFGNLSIPLVLCFRSSFPVPWPQNDHFKPTSVASGARADQSTPSLSPMSTSTPGARCRKPHLSLGIGSTCSAP